MNIVNWFDIHDSDHLRAWVHLSQTGMWPDGFLPEGIKFDAQWQIRIVMRMAEAWVTHGISGCDRKALRAAIDEICKHAPCPHDAVDTSLGNGKIWAKCYDCGETIQQESLDALREEYKRFHIAIGVLSQF